jgi:transposase-like protein
MKAILPAKYDEVFKMLFGSERNKDLLVSFLKVKTRGHFPNDEAAAQLIWRALRNITAHWGHPAPDWKEAMNQFAILYAERFDARRR